MPENCLRTECKGADMQCNLCGCHDFVEMNGRPNARCKHCGSFERTRLLWLYLERQGLTATTRVLHLAPERGLYERLRNLLDPECYVVADIDPKTYAFAADCRPIDLADMEGWASDQFELIVHSHVLEHIPCSLAYPLYHLHRMLKPNGLHIFLVPFSSGFYEECLGGIDSIERARRFGQDDHVRRFGKSDLRAHLGSILQIEGALDPRDLFGEEELRAANIPPDYWSGLHSGTVFQVRKEDYRLGAFEHS